MHGLLFRPPLTLPILGGALLAFFVYFCKYREDIFSIFCYLPFFYDFISNHSFAVFCFYHFTGLGKIWAKRNCFKRVLFMEWILGCVGSIGWIYAADRLVRSSVWY